MTLLLVYRRSAGVIEQKFSFGEGSAEHAVAKRLALERTFALDPDVEVVTLVAENEETLMTTHGRYFRNLAQLNEALARVEVA